MPQRDPADERDLEAIPSCDLKRWAEHERHVVLDFMFDQQEKKLQRARWAAGRLKKIDAELLRRRLALGEQS